MVSPKQGHKIHMEYEKNAMSTAPYCLKWGWCISGIMHSGLYNAYNNNPNIDQSLTDYSTHLGETNSMTSEHVCLCLSVSISRNYTFDLLQIFCACLLLVYLGSPLVLWMTLYLHIMGHIQACQYHYH